MNMKHDIYIITLICFLLMVNHKCTSPVAVVSDADAARIKRLLPYK